MACKIVKMIDVEKKTVSRMKWPLLAGECRYRDAANDSWWIGEIALWDGDALEAKLQSLYPGAHAVIIKLTSKEQFDIYDKTLTANILAGNAQSISKADIVSWIIAHAVALDENTVKELQR